MSLSEQQWALEWLSSQLEWSEILDRLRRDAAGAPEARVEPYPTFEVEADQAGPLAA
jgi:hypothetical protein